jgi:glutamine amidotransferase
VRTFLEPAAAAHSPLAKFVRENPIKTLLAIAHVRRRTRGRIALENTHPFVRELWGHTFVFAHNGTLRRVRRHKLGRFHPVGTTDSEHGFCVLLDRLAERFKRYPSRAKLSAAVAEIGAELGHGGTFNFLLGDGHNLFARCATKLAYIIRKAPFGKATLADDELRVDFADVTTPRDRVAVIATTPLTRDETWTLGNPNEMWTFDRGALVSTHES